MKKTLLLPLTFMALTLTSCDFSFNGNSGEIVGQLTSLPTPSIREVSNDYVYWDEVPNASSYVIKINNYQENAGNQLKYSISSIMDNRVDANVPTELHIYVKAKGNQILYSDSEWSKEFTYTYTKKQSTSSENDKPQLLIPTNIQLNKNILSWNAVPNAIGYNLKINSTTDYTTAMNSYDISTLFNKSTTFNIQLQSIASTGSSYRNSEWTVLTPIIYEKTSEETGQTYDISGIGFAVNVVTAKNYSDVKKGNTVLDVSKIQNSDFIYDDSNLPNRDFKSISSNSIKDFVSNSSVTMDLNIDTNTKMRTMYCNVSSGVSSYVSFKYSDYRSKNFYCYDSWIPTYSLNLKNYKVRETYKNLYSQIFLNDLQALYVSQSQIDFESFFNKYGTHIIGSALYGGRLNVYYTTVTNEFTIDSAMSSKIKAKVDAGISNVNNGKTDFNFENEMKAVFNEKNFESSFYTTASGGNVFTATDLTGFSDGYKLWANSLNDSKNSVLIKYAEDGLIALWDILPTDYQNMKDAMRTAFKKYYEDNFANFIDSFDYSNTIDYAGGAGTIDNPYKISNPQHLQNISLNPDSYFELIADISFDHLLWTPIKTFNGVLNGKNHTIDGMIIDSINKVDLTNMSVGFICENFGTIQNLNFVNLYMDVAHIENTSEKRRIVAGIVGTNKENGIIKNVTLKNSNFKTVLQFETDACGNNGNLTVSLGGIAGFNYGTVSYCISSENSFAASTNTKFNTCDNISIIGGIVGSNYSILNNSVSKHISMYSYSTGGYYHLFQGSGRLKCWNGYIAGNNEGTVAYCISYNQDSGSSIVDVNDFAKYTSVREYNGLAFATNSNKGKFDNVYVVKVDSLDFLGSNTGYSEYIKEASYIVNKTKLWTKWKYRADTDDFYFEN